MQTEWSEEAVLKLAEVGTEAEKEVGEGVGGGVDGRRRCEKGREGGSRAVGGGAPVSRAEFSSCGRALSCSGHVRASPRPELKDRRGAWSGSRRESELT
jgi:hypothetical protein